MIKTTMKIDGMMCGMCEAHINDAIRNAFPVKKVKASRARKEAEILAEELIDEAALSEVIERTGYTMTGFVSESVKMRGLFSR